MSTAGRISAIAAIGKETRVIGKDNNLVWHLPDDLKRFKKLTLGQPVIMGRKTFDSIFNTLGKPLPGRKNIVLSRQNKPRSENIELAGSLEEALGKARDLDQGEIFIIGGQQIYEEAMPFIDRLYLTLVEYSQDGDAYFPEYEKEFKKEIFREDRKQNGLTYTWTILER